MVIRKARLEIPPRGKVWIYLFRVALLGLLMPRGALAPGRSAEQPWPATCTQSHW